MREIINHRPALHIPPVDLTVAPGGRAANVQLGRQRVNAMEGRGRNPPQPQPLQELTRSSANTANDAEPRC